MSSLIEALFSRRSPSAIARFVIAVIVDSIYGMVSRGALAHVFVKGLERIKPTLTYGDSFSAIPIEVSSGWLRTAINHSYPDTKLICVGKSMCGFRFKYLVLNASTRMSAFQVAPRNRSFISAIASASVRRMTRLFRISLKRQNNEPTIASSGRNDRKNHPVIIPYFAV